MEKPYFLQIINKKKKISQLSFDGKFISDFKVLCFKLAFLFLFLSNSADSQTIVFGNPITGTNPNGSNPYITGQVTNSNISASGIGRGTGINGNNANNRYNANSWQGSSLDTSKYFSFRFKPMTDYLVNLSSLAMRLQKNNATVNNFELRSSRDNFTNAIGSISTTTVGGSGDSVTIDLSSALFQNIREEVSFRLYAWGANNIGRTLSVNNFNFYGGVLSCNDDYKVILNGVCYEDIQAALTSLSSTTGQVICIISNFTNDKVLDLPNPDFTLIISPNTILTNSSIISFQGTIQNLGIFNNSGTLKGTGNIDGNLNNTGTVSPGN